MFDKIAYIKRSGISQSIILQMLRLLRPIAVGASAAISTSSFCDKKKPMFNRTSEKTNLKEILNDISTLSIITGENNCGKSTTMHSLLDELQKKNKDRPILRVDLRGAGIDTPVDLVNRIAKPFNLSIFEKLPVGYKMKGAEATVSEVPEVKVEWEEVTPLQYASDYLDLVTYRLEVLFQESTGTDSLPILFIDEAQHLNELTKSPGGEAALRKLFDFCVLNTKQYPRCHIVLVSSDSFFLQWV